MSHWPYIIASYGLTLAGMGGLLLASWWRMREAEGQVNSLSGRGAGGPPSPFASSEVEKPNSARVDARFSTSLETNGKSVEQVDARPSTSLGASGPVA